MIKPKLLILTSSFPRNQVDQTCAYIRDLGFYLTREFDVTVLTSASVGAPRYEKLGEMTIVRFDYLLPRKWQALDSARDSMAVLRRRYVAKLILFFYLMAFLWRAWALARTSDLVLSHWLVPAGWIGSIISWALGKPHLVVEHSGALRLLRQIPFGRVLLRFLVTHSHRIVVVSRELRARLIELCAEARCKTSVVPMGVQVARFTEDVASQESQPMVLYLGRLTKVKGVEDLMRAMVGMRDAQLIVAGDGIERQGLEQVARKLRIDCVFLGSVDERQKRQWLSRCRAVVIPSIVLGDGRTEGLPVVCLEALAAGKPVVASRVGGLPEVIEHGGNGFLVEQGNTTELHERIRQLLLDGELRRALGERARMSAEQFDWSVIGKQYALLLRQGLESTSNDQVRSDDLSRSPTSETTEVVTTNLSPEED